MSRIIVIGCHGFVGSQLCEALRNQRANFIGVDVREGPYSKEHWFFQMDIRDEKALSRLALTEEDIVVHLASRQYASRPPHKNRQIFFDEVNVVGTLNIIRRMKADHCSKLIFFSSDMVYGIPQYLPVDTRHPLNPIAEYGKSKVLAEQLCQEFREAGASVTIFRPRLIIGPGRLGILSTLFRLIKFHLPVPLIGKGDNCYQMVSVRDCVAAILRAIEKSCPNKTYNLGSLNPPTSYDLLKNLITSVDSKSLLIKTNANMVKAILKMSETINIEILYREQYELADRQYIVDIADTMTELDWYPQDDDQDMIYQAYINFL